MVIITIFDFYSNLTLTLWGSAPLLSSRGTFGPSGHMGQGPIAPGRASLGLV